jgi:choline/glycine/proline betaine transport protein
MVTAPFPYLLGLAYEHRTESGHFFYSVHPRAYEPPTFVMRDTRDKRLEKLKFYRAEVHLKEGGQDYDVMGWGKDDLIHDVLEQYERHMHFLAAVR